MSFAQIKLSARCGAPPRTDSLLLRKRSLLRVHSATIRRRSLALRLQASSDTTRKNTRPRSSDILHLIQISPVALGLHVVAMDEPQRGRVDAIAQAASIRRAIGKDVTEMAVAMRRTHLGADHAVGGVPQFVDVGGLDRLGETWPAASRFDICRTKRTTALPRRCRRRCPVPCYPDIRRFRGVRCRSAGSRDTVRAIGRKWLPGVFAIICHLSSFLAYPIITSSISIRPGMVMRTYLTLSLTTMVGMPHSFQLPSSFTGRPVAAALARPPCRQDDIWLRRLGRVLRPSLRSIGKAANFLLARESARRRALLQACRIFAAALQHQLRPPLERQAAYRRDRRARR